MGSDLLVHSPGEGASPLGLAICESESSLGPDIMHLLLLQLLVLPPLGKAAWPQEGGQSQSSVPPVLLLERSPSELPLGNHGEAEEKPDLFVAVPHLVGASISGGGQWQREKMLFRFGRFWKKPERELHPTQDPVSEQGPPGTQALPQSKAGMQIKKSPLQEEAKRFWHRFMFRMSPASQGVILPIKSHEVHQETCRTLPFSQVSVLGGEGIRVCRKQVDSWGRWGGGGEELVLPNSQTWSLAIHPRIWQSMVIFPKFPSKLSIVSWYSADAAGMVRLSCQY